MKVVNIQQLSDLNHSAIKEYQKEHPSDEQGDRLGLSVALTQMLHWEGVIGFTGRIMEVVQAAVEDKPKRKLYTVLASNVGAFHRCVEGENNEWKKKWEAEINKLVYERMPSGSGWDNGTKIDLDSSTEDRLVFYGAYHHMTEGYYDGWTDHSIIVTPSFSGFDLKITGRNRNDIKEYLHQMFDAALEQEV